MRALRLKRLATSRFGPLSQPSSCYDYSKVLEFLLDLVFPKKCVSCGKLGKFICGQCFGKIEFFENQVCPYCERQSLYGLPHPRCFKPQGLDGMFVLAHYRGPIRLALRKAKYQGTFGLFGELGKLVVNSYHHNFDFDYLVPVPMHPNRERERGFNQAAKLAQSLNYELGIMDYGHKRRVLNCLIRTRETKPQFDLKFDKRKENVKDAFAIAGHLSLVTGHSFCLIDDVATTGATIFECAKVLKQAGAKNVWSIAVARGG